MKNYKYLFCVLLIAAFCALAACKDEPDSVEPDNGYKNPNVGISREFTFSHDSGLYANPFSLAITAPEGSDIYYSTDGSIPLPAKAGKGYVYKYKSPITVQNRDGQPNVLAAYWRDFYGDIFDPRGSMPTPYRPTNAQVPKATVIRALAVDPKGVQSGVITKTFFIGNNLASYGNNRVLSIVTDPYNLVDINYGIMVRGRESNRWPEYNFNHKGIDWEREAYLELFDQNRKVPLSTGVGIRVRGGWSRTAGQKSFNVYFRDTYGGINNLKNYPLIPGAVTSDGKPVATFKGFMLRNGGNDGDYTKFYDVFLQDLVSDRSFTTQAAVPCILYLNGEYWGPYNLQERYSDNHTEYKYGVQKENVISYDNWEIDDGTAADESLYWQMLDMRNRDMSAAANYAAFCNAFDIQSYVDYWAAETYIYNEDWPNNNFRLWRTRTVEPGNPYGDAKWRYQMFDTEFALGIYSSGGLRGIINRNPFDKIINGDDKDNPNNQMFIALLANDDFCRRFVTAMMDLYNVNFHPDSWQTKLNDYAAVYKPLMNGYYPRWGSPWYSVFDNKVSDARKYLTDVRNVMVTNYLPTYFRKLGISSSSLRDVTLSVSGASDASIRINSVTPVLKGSWKGRYYSNIPVTVTASAPPAGLVFDKWTVTGGTAETPSALTTVVNFTSNVTITANYK
jgi:hypothetical protein